jgi:hypothetical protein
MSMKMVEQFIFGDYLLPFTWNHLSSQLLCKYFNIITKKTVILPAVLKGKNTEDLSKDGRIILLCILKEIKCENVGWLQFIQIGRLL